MGTKQDNYGTIYDLLIDCEKNGTLFKTREAAVRSGYKESALKVYVRNKLRNIYLFTQAHDTYAVRGIMAVDRSTFIDLMSQKAARASAHPLIVDRLIDCSISSFYLAIANYNNPAVNMRTEAFCLLIVNAWELLLKAKIISSSGLASVTASDGFTINISNAIQQVFPKPDDPCRGNLELIVRLRNQATHFVIEELCDYYSRWFQSCIINYIEFLQNKMLVRGRLDLGSRGLVVTSEEATIVDLDTISMKYGQEIVDDFTKLRDDLRIQEASYDSSRFAIPVNHRVTISRNSGDAKTLLRLDLDGKSGYFVEIPKDPEKTHTFREFEIVREIEKMIPDFGQTAFRAILHCEGIKTAKSSPYHYHFETANTHKYSDRLIGFIVTKHKAEPQYIALCIAKHKREIARARRHKARSIS